MGSSSGGRLRAVRLWAAIALIAGSASAATNAARASSDPIAASRRLKEQTIAPLAHTQTGITRDQGALAIIEHDGSDYSRLAPDGTPNYAPRARVARTFYEDHADAYDFVVVFTNFPFDAAGAVGFHNLVRNDVAGIGLPPVNNGPQFGSPGRLKGYVDMGPIDQYRAPPYSTDPSAPGFRDAVDVLAHEIGHQWLARARYRDAAGQVSTDLLGLDQGHWSYLLDSDASLFYGSDWLPAGEGVYRASRVQQAYSSLDLYLMGLLDPARVAPFTLLRNPSVNASQLPVEGATVQATPETVNVAQVIAAEGARLPDHRASQKDFRIGFIVLAAPGVDPAADLEDIDRLREAFELRFLALTRGVAFADTTLGDEPVPPPGPAADLDRALAWLRTRQAQDGRWEDASGSAVRDTAAVLTAFDASGDSGPPYARGQSFVRGTSPASLDFAARRASALALDPLAPATRTALLASIFAYGNADGGFGAGRGYETDALDTALALRALRDLGAPADSRVRGAVLALGALRLPEGGWELVAGRGPSSLASAHVLLALHDWIDLPEASALVPAAVAELAGRQNPDGGFGESPSTVHGTTQALLALDRAGAPAAVLDRATAWLQRTQQPEGSWRGRSYETALAVAALKGRTAPNLVLRQDDLHLDPSQADEGEVVQVTARIRNTGRLPAPASIVRLFDGVPSAASAVDEATLPPLDPGQDATVALEFPTADRPGTHVVTVQADADASVSEVREDDNTASRSLEVRGPMPDLAIRASDIVVVPYPPEADETVQVRVTVTNRGTREAGPTQVRLYRGHPAANGSPIGSAPLAPLAPGAAATLVFDWLASGPPGNAVLAAVADATFAVLESDETNNQAIAPVTITGPTGPGVDLEVPLLELDPTVLSTLPQAVSARILVRNVGSDPASSTIALFGGSAVGGVLLGEAPVSLAGRSSTVVTVPFQVATSGTRTYTAVADRAATVTEIREDNNQATAILVDPGNTLDVAVAAVAPASSDLVVGETLSVAVTVRNRGTMPITDVPVILARVEGGLAELDRERVTLGPGVGTTVTLTWPTSITGDAIPLAVVADPFDLLPERDESNNRGDFAVRVRPSPLANLHISGADITFEPDPPFQGGSAIVRARIGNPSPVGAGAFVVRFFVGDPAGGGALIGEAAVPGVAGQSEVLAQVTWALVDVSGAQGVFVVADAGGQVEEYDESDNVGFRPFQVIGLPNLSVSSAELVLEPAFPRAGDEVTVRATVRNQGQRPSAASTLRVFEGEPASGTLLTELPIPDLPPGQSATLALAWTPANEGERTIAALADADDVVPESSEGDNLARRTVLVQDADFSTSAPYFSPDGDGVQDETVLAYRATGPVRVIVSDARGHRVRTLADAAPSQGTIPWDGRDDRGRLLPDGVYALTLQATTGTVLSRLDVVLDTNRSPIHDAAGTGLVAVRTIDAFQTNARGPAWMPSEDEVLAIIPTPSPLAGLVQGLLRWRLDGTRSYVVQDPWYDLGVRFASSDPVSPDGREVLVTKDGALIAVDVVTGARRVVTSGSGATWSPDGGFLGVGNTVLRRDGSLVATLPIAAAMWSPDGTELLEGRVRVTRDGSTSSEVPLPVELSPPENLGGACFLGSFWRNDGRIVLKIGRWREESVESAVITVCGTDRVYAHDPETGDTVEATALRGLRDSNQWSTDGSRLLHTARAGESQEVTREQEGPGLELWPALVLATPRRTAVFTCGPTNEHCFPTMGRMSVVTSLLNLTADLAPVPLPGGNGVLLKGTVSDANLDRWQLDYAATASPTNWHPIGAASTAPVVDGLLATWIPSEPATYLVRLTVWDRAGGRRIVTRVVSWAQTPPLSNITQDERMISPNDDGVKDAVRFDFLVHEPTRLEARVEGPRPPIGTPGQPPVVRRFSLDLPAIGPAHLVWDGRDLTGQRVPDGRYVVYLNEVPFELESDATPPEIGLRHDNLRPANVITVFSPGEIQGPTGECAGIATRVLEPALDRYWHVVDPHLRRWSHGVFEGGTAPIYVPELDENGSIVYVDGVAQVARVDGRPVDRKGLAIRPNWPGTLVAEDLAGNVSSIASPGVPTGLFVVGHRPGPRCLPAGSAPPPTRAIEGDVVKLTPKTRFFVMAAPGDVGGKRFQFRASDSDPWSNGPISTLEWDDIVDVDLVALGIQPGRTYRGRFVDVGSSGATSDEFAFKLCTESINLRLGDPEPITGTSQSRYVVDLEVDVAQPPSAATLRVTGSGALQGFFVGGPFERVGPTTYRKVVVAPTTGCSPEGQPAILGFEANVRGPDGSPWEHDGACVNLVAHLGQCPNGLVITQEAQSCDVASSDRVVLEVEARSSVPDAVVVLERRPAAGAPVPVAGPYSIGTVQCGTVAGPAGPLPLYCDKRQVVADVTGLPDGTTQFAGRIERPVPPSALVSGDLNVRVDHTPPAVTVPEPPEGASVCVQRDGLTETVRLAIRAEDAASSVNVVDASYRFGDGAWQPICLDTGCGPWQDLPTGQTVDRRWDVRGLMDGAYEVRLEVCDGSGNRFVWTRTVSISRAGSAIDVASSANQDFSPDGDGRADETRVTVQVPQSLRLAMDVHAGDATGPLVRHLAEQQLAAGLHEFVWDGRTAGGSVAADGRYAITGRSTNACGGIAEDSAWVQLDTVAPVTSITSPAPGALVQTTTDVLGESRDPRFASYELSYGPGASPAVWTSFATSTHPVGGAAPGALGAFQPPLAEGTYTLRLVARDRATNEAESRVVVQVGPRAFLERIGVAPDAISPNGDGRRDVATVEYELRLEGRVTLDVRDAGGVLLRRLESAIVHSPGTYTAVWDGTRADGAPAPEGSHHVFVRVEDPTGAGPAQEQTVAILVDRTPPTTEVASPQPGGFVAPDRVVHGSIADASLREYTVRAVRPFTAAVGLATGTQSQLDADLAALAPLADGPWEIVITAEDVAENRSETRVPITMDAVLPQALITAPAPGSVVARSGTPIAIVGSAADAHLESYELAFGAGAAPAEFVPIVSGTQAVTSGPLGAWTIAGLPDGPYVLRLLVRDRAGRTAEARSAVVLDGRPPDASITAPAAGAALNASVTIRGTAADATLSAWRLEAAPGDAATAFQWSTLAEGDAPVTDAPLAEWAPLPPDGAHTLRLVVSDRAGHEIAVLRTVTIDTQPPATPGAVSSTIARDGSSIADVTLSWPANGEPDLAGYAITRNGAAVGPPLVVTPGFVDEDRPEGTYAYEVRAVDRAGNASAPRPHTVTVDLTPPTVVLLQPAPGSRVSGSIDVRGTAFSLDDFSELRLLAGDGAVPTAWTLVARSTVPVSAGLLGTWTPTQVGPHVLALEAEDQAGNEARVTVDVIVDLTPPAAPVLLTVENVPVSTTLTATWEAPVEPDIAGFLLYRNGRLVNAPAVVIGDLRPYLVPGPAYADALLPDGPQCYRVVTMDEAGNVSAPSNELCATLDNRPPHAVLVEPPDGTRFDHPLRLVATTPDLDVGSVRFEITPAALSDWIAIGSPDTLRPYEATLDPVALALGAYRVRAVAFESGGEPDPAPAAITVTYGDATPPAPLTGLSAHVVGGAVSLTWTAGSEPDLAGYHVYRDGVRVTAAPQAAVTFDETLAEGEYEYAVTAIDTDGNESLPASTEAVVYRLELDPVVPVLTAGPVTLTGSGTRAGGTVEILRAGLVVADAPVGAAGGFRVEDVGLAPGPNLLRARQRGASGDVSLESDEGIAISNTAPDALTGLTADVSGLQVALAWDPSADPEVFGYEVRRDGEARTPVVAHGDASAFFASSALTDENRPPAAFDGDVSTAWIPATFDQPSYWQVHFPRPVLVTRVALDFRGPSGPAPAPAHRIEVEWEGRFVPLLASPGSTQSQVAHALAAPFATQAVRVSLAPAFYVGLAEVAIQRVDVVPAATPAFVEDAPNGIHVYEVAPIDRYGARGPASAAEVALGDVEAPPAPDGLTATVIGSAVTLSWNPVVAPDLAGYVVRRDGVAIGESGTTGFVDANRPNGTFAYTVRARDLAGNQSADSDPAIAVVGAPAPPAPVVSANAPASGGVHLSWTHPGAARFVVRRSVASGGPFATIVETGDVREHLDLEPRPGATVFYVVRAVDAAGNASIDSNEVAVTTATPAPTLLRLTDADHPASVRGTAADFGGRAWTGAVVALTVDGELRGTAEGGRAFDQTESLEVPEGAFAPRVSPDGRSLSYALSSDAGPLARWREWATGDVDGLEGSAMPAAFAPDGRRLAHRRTLCDGVSCQADLDAIDLDTHAVSHLENGPEDAQDLEWAHDGHRVAAILFDVAASRWRLVEIEAATGARRTLAELATGIGGPRWSPDDAEIAVQRWDDTLQALVLDVVRVSDGAVQTLPDAVGWSTVSWSPIERTIVYTSVGGDRPRLRSWNLETDALTDLTDGVRAAIDPRIDPTGEWLSYVRFDEGEPVPQALVVRHRATGSEREVFAWTTDFAGTPDVHEWVRGGYLALGAAGHVRLFPSFDGAFHLPAVALVPGVNHVEAEAIEVSTGSISAPSAPAVVTVPVALFPNLLLSAADLAAYPRIPTVGQPSVLSARVRNGGPATAGPSTVRLTLVGPGGVRIEQASDLSSIAPGGQAVASMPWTPAAAGTYLWRAEADAEQAVVEGREDDNTGEIGVFVVEAGGLSLHVDADRGAYLAHAPVLVTIDVANGGSPFVGTLVTRVLTTGGSPVATIDERAVSFPFGHSQRISIGWNTGVTRAGDYVLEVRASSDATVIAQDAHPFRIEPDVAVWTRVVPDDPTVPSGTPVALRVRVENRGANTELAGASARLRVVPVAGGPAAFASMASVPALGPGSGWDVTFTWPSAAPMGLYSAALEVADAAGLILATAQAPIEVRTPDVTLTGTLAIMPGEVLRGAPFRATVTATQSGAAPLVQAFALDVARPPAVPAVLAVPFELTLPANGSSSIEVDVPTGALEPGSYFVFLRAAGASASLDREPLRVRATITRPSVDAPADGSRVQTEHPDLRVNNGSAAGSDLQYEFQLFRDPALTLPLPGASGVPETPERTSWRVAVSLGEDATYYWRARATDGFSSSAWTDVASFTVDAVNERPGPPTPESPGAGAHVASLQPTLVVTNAFDPELDVLEYDFRLARDPSMADIVAATAGVAGGPLRTSWPVPVPLTEDEQYFWSARARDAGGPSPWTAPIGFIVDTGNEPPSATILLRPPDGSEVATLTPELAIGPATDPEGDALVYRIEVDRVPTFDSIHKQASPALTIAGSEAAWVPPLPLPDNASAYWRASAFDGHTMGPWSARSLFANLANDAPGAPVPLDPGAGSVVTTQTPVLRVQNAIDVDRDVLTYAFEVRDAGGALAASVDAVPQTPTHTSWPVAVALAENGLFTWRARAHDGETFGPWTEAVPFRVNSTNDPPTEPILVAPPEGSTVTIARPEMVVANATSPDLLPLSYTFELYRLDAGGGAILVDSIAGVSEGPVETSWTPQPDLLDGDYSWRARAVDANQAGPWMASAHFHVAIDLAPAPPTGLTAIAGDGRVGLTWSLHPEPDVIGYRVYRGSVAGGPHGLVGSTTTPAFEDTGLANGETVYYVVTALDTVHESAPSQEVAATPTAGPLTAEVLLWPAILEGECLQCPPPPDPFTPSVEGASPRPILQCIRDDGALGRRAFFGFENAGAAAVSLPIGAANAFDPAPIDRGQPTLFPRGRAPEFPGPVSVAFSPDVLTWVLNGQRAIARRTETLKTCPLPATSCPQWIYATIEPGASHDPGSIAPASVRLAGTIAADPTYHVLVDRDGDGRPEQEVRFALGDVRPLLTPGTVALGVTGSLGAQTFAGGADVVVAEPKARLEIAPTVWSRSQPGLDLRAWITLRECYGGGAIAVDSLRVNGQVPVKSVLGISGGLLMVTFDRAAVLAVLPLGDQDVVVTGTALGQPFRAIERLRVVK